MKRYRLIARQQIINPQTHRVHDDEGLKALDGYWQSQFYEYADNVDPEAVFRGLVEKYENSPEAMPNCKYELISI